MLIAKELYFYSSFLNAVFITMVSEHITDHRWSTQRNWFLFSFHCGGSYRSISVLLSSSSPCGIHLMEKYTYFVHLNRPKVLKIRSTYHYGNKWWCVMWCFFCLFFPLSFCVCVCVCKYISFSGTCFVSSWLRRDGGQCDLEGSMYHWESGCLVSAVSYFTSLQ